MFDHNYLLMNAYFISGEEYYVTYRETDKMRGIICYYSDIMKYTGVSGQFFAFVSKKSTYLILTEELVEVYQIAK